MPAYSKYLNYNEVVDYASSFLLKLKSTKPTRLSLFGILAALSTSYIIIKWIRMQRYFRKLNIPSPFTNPLIGGMAEVIRKGMAKYDEEIFKKYGKIVGYYEGSVPVILCSDIDMIKHVLIKDFNYFVNRRKFEAINIDPLNSTLMVLRDEEWKNVRSIVSTTFTSGKLKQMLECMLPGIDILIDYFDSHQGEFDPKDCFQMLTFDVITSCCFGISTDSINNPDDIVIKHLKKALSQQISLKFLLAIMFPKIMLRLNKMNVVELFPKDTMKFFKEVTDLSLQQRRSKQQFRNDFLQIMVEHEEAVKNEQAANTASNTADTKAKWQNLKKTLSNSEIVSQAIVFLLAGSETTATTLTYVAYLMAMHPDVQNKLYNEIEDAFREHNEVSYEMINSIEYLDMVVDETLRLFPPVLRIDRECNADYTYKNMKIPKGIIWSASIWALHHDPSIYPEPEKFIPERFSAENKKTRDSCAYIPFGNGPRNCIGLRFALQEIKLSICKLLLKFEFVACEKTPKTIEIDNSGLAKSKVPIILKVIKRNSN